MASVYEDIVKERSAQDAEFGGARVDDTKPHDFWLILAGKHLGKACSGWVRGERGTIRDALVRVAAICVAAVESMDRCARPSKRVDCDDCGREVDGPSDPRHHFNCKYMRAL